MHAESWLENTEENAWLSNNRYTLSDPSFPNWYVCLLFRNVLQLSSFVQTTGENWNMFTYALEGHGMDGMLGPYLWSSWNSNPNLKSSSSLTVSHLVVWKDTVSLDTKRCCRFGSTKSCNATELFGHKKLRYDWSWVIFLNDNQNTCLTARYVVFPSWKETNLRLQSALLTYSNYFAFRTL